MDAKQKMAYSCALRHKVFTSLCHPRRIPYYQSIVLKMAIFGYNLVPK